MNENTKPGAPAARTTLVIDRPRWLRGEGGIASRLLRASDGKMCCLGFFGLACGFTREDVLENSEPSNLLWSIDPDRHREKARAFNRWPDWLLRIDDEEGLVEGDVVTDLMEVNDRSGMEAAEREARIVALFAANGVDVQFTDGPEVP